ncbi:MAG: rhomboid family intramembrane serine protease [Deltaproteobacteria bacterium]|nr:rhomboid family intramembrane serine protease [Deltaproteobacteria bacterium]
MIPIRDTLHSHRSPLVNYALIALCTIAFVLELRAGADIDALLHDWALVPSRFVSLIARDGLLDSAPYRPLLSSMFLHGSIAHFAGNMLFLWVFGDNVEDRLGHLRYGLFYLAGGVVAGLAHVAASPESIVPTIGASGAIAAVMGAYMLLYPHAHVHTLVIFVFIVRVISVPAVVWLGLWFVFQVIAGAQEASVPGQGGVAWWAHAGGFAFGAAVVLVFGLRAPRAAAAR